MNNTGNKIIINVYKYRCMTFKQIVKKTQIEEEKIYENIMDLLKFDYISYDETSAINPMKSDNENSEPEMLIYFALTKKGYDYYKEELVYNKLLMHYDSVQSKNILNNNVLGYDKYKMSHKMAKHQIHLVNFAINFEKMFKGKLKFTDEKEYKNKYNYLKTRPDATIETEDTIYLIEIDMSTESSQQLNAKFDKYVDIFQNSKRLYDKNKDIVILFINNTEERSYVVRHEALKELTLFLDESDFIIGTEYDIFNILFDNKFKLKETRPFKDLLYNDVLKEDFNNKINYMTYDYNGGIKGLNNKLLFMEYNYNLFSITFLESLNVYKLPISYVILINDKEDIFHFESANDKYVFILKNDFEEYGLKASKYLKRGEMLEEL